MTSCVYVSHVPDSHLDGGGWVDPDLSCVAHLNHDSPVSRLLNTLDSDTKVVRIHLVLEVFKDSVVA